MDINQLNKAYAEQYAKDHNLIEKYKDCTKQKPLSDDETIQLACDIFYGLIKKEERDNFIRFARAIEERHGIK